MTTYTYQRPSRGLAMTLAWLNLVWSVVAMIVDTPGAWVLFAVSILTIVVLVRKRRIDDAAARNGT